MSENFQYYFCSSEDMHTRLYSVQCPLPSPSGWTMSSAEAVH